MLTGGQIASWLRRLVQIPSVAPEYAGPRAGAPGEARAAAQVAAWLKGLGGEVHVHEVLPGRPNVYGIWRAGPRWLGIDVHLDTVGVEEMPDDPFSGTIAGGRVYGRGAVDTKASLAVALALLEELGRQGQRPSASLLIAATVDEEHGARGAPALADWLSQQGITLDEMIVAEPTGCRPVYGHTGVVRLALTAHGHAAHSSHPQLGANAITASARLALALDAEHARLQALPPTPLGNAALTVTLIAGGSGLNIVPERCRLALDRRLVAGEQPEAVIAALGELAAQSCPLPLTSEQILAIRPFFQQPDVPWLHELAAWSGQQPAVVSYGTNAWAYSEVARACAVLGPGDIAQAHGAEEWVEIAQLEQLAALYRRWWQVT